MTQGSREVTQEDLDSNPILAEMGAVVGDSLVVEKAPASSDESSEDASDDSEDSSDESSDEATA